MMQSNFSKEDEADLLHRLKAGEQEAWTEFARYYGAKLHKFLDANLPDQESLEDTISETMLAAVKAIKTFDGKASLTTMIHTLALRQLAHYWRKHTSTQDIAQAVNITSPAVDTLVEDRLEFLEALATLPENEQQVLLLRYQLGLRMGKIAEIMENSESAMERLLASARKHLREALTDVVIESAPDSLKLKSLIQSLMQMVQRQVQRCLALGMKEEAALFSRYANVLLELANEFSIQHSRECL